MGHAPLTFADLAYVRFHGQNREQWTKASTRDERYDYDYSDEELQSWVSVIHDLSTQVKDTYVYFNNHYQGKAAKNAKTFGKVFRIVPTGIRRAAAPYWLNGRAV
jgi:uncharacterized protein YecE (DUF72 family)